MDSPLRRALSALANRQSLSEEQTTEVFGVVMSGEATPAQIGGLLLGLRAKGETADELAGATRALRAAMVRIDVPHEHLVDTCGTGGGTVSTFNISTVAAFVAAGAGAVVPKHGNRSYTSRCGSADVLEALGLRIMLDAPTATRVLHDARVVFLFAPNFHPAMKHVGAVRRELGTPKHSCGSAPNMRSWCMGASEWTRFRRKALRMYGRSRTVPCGVGKSTPSASGWRSRTCVSCRAEIPLTMRRASSESWGMAPRRRILPAWRRCC